MQGAIRYMRKRRLKLFLFVIGDAIQSKSLGATMETSNQIRSCLMVLQKRAGLSPYWLEVWEVTPNPHVNLIAPATEDIALKMAEAYPEYFVGGFGTGRETGRYAIQPVYDARHLQTYLAKERTSRASFALHMPRQKTGRFPNEFIGDRVRLSRALKRHAIEAGDVKDWQRTNAKRSSFKSKKTAKPASQKTEHSTLKCWLPLPMSPDNSFPSWYPIAWMDTPIKSTSTALRVAA